MCSKSDVVLLAFHHSARHLCFLLLENHLVAPTPRQGRGQSASAAAASRRRSINFYGCLKPSIKGSEQDTEEHHQDDDHHHFLLHCFMAAWPIYARRHVLRPESVRVCRFVLLSLGDSSHQLLCQSFHLCYRHVPVSERKVRCQSSSTGAQRKSGRRCCRTTCRDRKPKQTSLTIQAL